MVSCHGIVGFCGCLLLLIAASIIAWRFGPWYNSPSKSNNTDAAAGGPCEGCCNGLPSNCALPVNQVLFPAVHNAHSSYENSFLAANNDFPLEDALRAGYRALMLDSCLCDTFLAAYLMGKDRDDQEDADIGADAFFMGASNNPADSTQDAFLGFCHTFCDAGVRDPARVLSYVHSFLDTNTNEVVIIDFQINNDSLNELYSALEDAGLLAYAYRPPTSISSPNDFEWPTLQSLIDANQRLLLFAHGDSISTCYNNNNDNNNCPSGIFYKHDHFFQTAEDDVTSCQPDSQTSSTKLTNHDSYFFLMNHWQNNDIQLPSQTTARKINTYNHLQSRFANCFGSSDPKFPSLLAVDFWDVGEVLDFVHDENERRAMEKGILTYDINGEPAMTADAVEAKSRSNIGNRNR